VVRAGVEILGFLAQSASCGKNSGAKSWLLVCMMCSKLRMCSCIWVGPALSSDGMARTGDANGTTTWEIDGKASGWASTSLFFQDPERSGCAPSPIAGATEDVTQGGISVKKIAVRVAAVAGGVVALLLAGGAGWVAR
jgi:hypothetical protein